MPKKNKVPKEEAPRDVSEDQPPVDAPPTGRTRPPHPLDQPPVEPPEDDLREMERYPTVDEMHKRINTNISVLLQRFENIMAMAAALNDSHVSTAVEGFQLDNEVTTLIRAAEDIMALTRTMKEMWLFGKLNTLGETKEERERREKMEADVLAIWKAIEDSNLKKFSSAFSDESSEKPGEKPTEQATEPATETSAEDPAQEPSAEK